MESYPSAMDLLVHTCLLDQSCDVMKYLLRAGECLGDIGLLALGEQTRLLTA
jgi:hypothetical protein